MSNVEHPKDYQLSVDIDILEIINIVMYNTSINCYNGYLLGTTIEYLFKADKNNELKYYKIALYYLEKTFKAENDKLKYTPIEFMFNEKIIRAFKNKNTQMIISYIINLDLKSAEKVLKQYIKKQEKQNEI